MTEMTLTGTETELIQTFRRLNADGKRHIMITLRMVAQVDSGNDNILTFYPLHGCEEVES